jgi:hypothetical protein
MNIKEAAKQASENGQSMFRESMPDIYIFPTNTPECCIMAKSARPFCTPRWELQLDDLLADDWGVTGQISKENQ